MAVLFLAGVFVAYSSEARGNPLLAGVSTRASESQSGGNMEGKEVRFGIANSALFTTVTTDASCGAVNNMHDSLTPIGGMVPLINIQLGEVIFGGVGAGMYGILVFVILSVFIAGLMVGRTPEYLGKKIESFDVKMAVLAILITSVTILVFSAVGVVAKFGTVEHHAIPARTDYRKSSMPTPRRSEITAPALRVSTPTPTGTTRASRWRCSWDASSWSFRFLLSRAVWRQRNRCRNHWALSRSPGRCSPCC